MGWCIDWFWKTAVRLRYHFSNYPTHHMMLEIKYPVLRVLKKNDFISTWRITSIGDDCKDFTIVFRFFAFIIFIIFVIILLKQTQILCSYIFFEKYVILDVFIKSPFVIYFIFVSACHLCHLHHLRHILKQTQVFVFIHI